MPKSVFEGFTLAVALIIGLKQLNYAFGLHGYPFSCQKTCRFFTESSFERTVIFTTRVRSFVEGIWNC